MNYKIKIALFVLILCIDSCKSDNMEKAISDANTSVMTLHEETMAKHGEIMNLVDELKKKTTDSLYARDVVMDSIRTELDGLNEEMMDWMADFEEPDSKDEAALTYLKEQIEILTKLKTAQVQNIETAKSLLQK